MSLLKAVLGFASICLAPALLAQSITETTLTVTSGGNPVSTVKEAVDEVALTATVTIAGSAAKPPGQVNFCEVKAPPLKCTDIRLLGTEQLLSSGTAVFNFYPGPGTHTYQAVFLGTHVEAASSSITATLDVTAPTVTIITSSGSPANYTLNAIVTGTGLTVPPSGTASFEDTSNSNYVLAAAPLIGNPAPPDFSISSTPGLDAPYPDQLLSADFNGDGKPDLVATVTQTNSLGRPVPSVAVYLGNGDGTFTAAPSSSTSPSYGAYSPGLLATGDFNGDGKPDLIVGINSTQIKVLLGNGDGTFNQGQILPSTSTIYLSPTGAYTIAVGDFNGDGVEDLAITEIGTAPDAQVAIWLGNGDGTFTLKTTIPVGDGSEPAVVGDFNGDGILDLAVVNSGNGNLTTTTFPQVQGSVTILLGNGDGTFTTVPATPATGWLPLAITAGDFNGDGILDLAVANDGQYGVDTPGGQGQYPGSVTVLLGNGDGTFTPAATLATALGPVGIAVGDFNGDGKADLVTSNDLIGQDHASVLLGNGDGTFAPALELATGEASMAAMAKDFNDDGLADIAVSNYDSNSVSIFLSQLGLQSAAAAVNGISVVGTGTHQVDASYSGDSNYQPSTSATTGLTAEPLPTTLTLAATPSGTSYGQQVALTATISPGNAQTQNHLPSGTVTFSSGSSTLGTATVSDGVAVFNTTSLPVGTDTIVAAYSGDANFMASSGSATDTIGNYGTTTALAVAPSPGGAGLTLALTATVTGVATTLVPTGTVTFFDGTTPLGSVAVGPSGQAVFTSTTLAIGVHSLKASYGGSAVFTASNSPPVSETILKPDFSIALAAPSITLQKYQNTTTTITLASIGAFADTLALTCSNLPVYFTCLPRPTSTPLTANGSATASLYLDTDSILGGDGKSGPLAHSGGKSGPSAMLDLVLFPAFVLALRRKRRSPRLSLALLVCLALPVSLVLTSCGGNQVTPVPGVAPGTYTIPITATDATTGLVHSAQLTLTVTP